MWYFSHTVVSYNFDFNTKSGHLLFIGHTPAHVGSVDISPSPTFELWVEENLDNTTIRAFRWVSSQRSSGDSKWSHDFTWISLSCCCVFFAVVVAFPLPGCDSLAAGIVYPSHDGTMHSLNNECLHIIHNVFTLRRGVHAVPVQRSASGRLLDAWLIFTVLLQKWTYCGLMLHKTCFSVNSCGLGFAKHCSAQARNLYVRTYVRN